MDLFFFLDWKISSELVWWFLVISRYWNVLSDEMIKLFTICIAFYIFHLFLTIITIDKCLSVPTKHFDPILPTYHISLLHICFNIRIKLARVPLIWIFLLHSRQCQQWSCQGRWGDSTTTGPSPMCMTSGYAGWRCPRGAQSLLQLCVQCS